MNNILLLGSGTQALALAEDLHAGGFDVYLLTRLRHTYADDSKNVKKVFFSKNKTGDDAYHQQVIDIINRKKISAIIPMGDMTARYVSERKDSLQKIVDIKVTGIDVFEKGYDKHSLMKICEEKDYPHPFTIYNIDNVESLCQTDLPYPMLIKPNYTCGGRGMTLVRDYEELRTKFSIITETYGDCHIQQYVKQGGYQVEVQLLVDDHGDLLASSVIQKFRWYPEKGGSSCCATAIKNEKIVRTLHGLLKDIGWVGFADFDTIENPDTGELLIMELNPRVPACVRAAILAGTHWGQILAAYYMGLPIPKTFFEPNKILRHFGMETLWFLHSKNRFKTSPSWFKFFGKNIYYQDVIKGDMWPFIKGTLNNLKKQMNPSFRKSKSGTR